MRSLRTVGFTVLAAVAALTPGAGVPQGVGEVVPIPAIRAPQHHDLSAPMSGTRQVLNLLPPLGGGKEADAGTGLPPTPQGHAFAKDPVLQSTPGASNAAPAPVTSFDGIDSSAGGYPPDPNGAVGPADYVQAVNGAFEVFDKRGHRLLGPNSISSLWSGFGGQCENSGRGDPVVLYDPFADRFVLSQFAYGIGANSQPTGPYYECIAVTKTSDPTADWYRYAFLTSATKLDDYPKLGVWPDGYYMTMNQFNPDGSWAGVGLAAFDRAAMLTGQDASMLYLDSPVNSNGVLPASATGWTAPPAGSPEYLVG